MGDEGVGQGRKGPCSAFLAVEVEGDRVFGLVLVTVKRIGMRQKKPRHGFCVLNPRMLVCL